MVAVTLFKQPTSLQEISRGRRWLILLIGLVETALWSGTIFGWASLVHIMKTQGVFSHLCSVVNQEGNRTAVTEWSRNETMDEGDSYVFEVVRGCREQDERFTLIGTVALVLYTTPGILVGYGLHHLGQAFTRITASILITLGFVFLSLTGKETPNLLWAGSILVSVGGNMIRVACFEFGNLFPKQRNTVMAIISGIYTISAALFLAMQSAFEAGYSWEYICQLMAIGSAFISLTTVFIPWHHIPHEEKAGPEKQSKYLSKDPAKPDDTEMAEIRKLVPDSTGKITNSHGIPLKKSVFSISMGLLQFWLFNNMFSVTIFGTYFNSWINKFSKNHEEVAYYSRLFGYANICCIFTTPLPGLIIDLLSAHYKKGKTGVEEKVAIVQSMIAPMLVISVTVTVQITCFFFFSSWAVYLGLLCLIINRPGCLGVGIPFMRSRFPADHFNRMIGIQGTVISLLSTLQYPHFTWTQSDYFPAIGTLVGLLALSVFHPLHMFNKKYLRRVFSEAE